MMDEEVTALNKKFTDANFQQRGDTVKMALVLFVKSFLFRLDYKKNVSPWLFILWRSKINLTVSHEKICEPNEILVSVLGLSFFTF